MTVPPSRKEGFAGIPVVTEATPTADLTRQGHPQMRYGQPPLPRLFVRGLL